MSARRSLLAAAALTAALAGPLVGAACAEPPGHDGSAGVLGRNGILTGDLHGLRPPPDVAADSWIVADADTGEILAAKRALVSHPPASTLKVLTALAVAHTLDPDATVAAPANVEAIDGTRVGLVPGAKYSVRDLMTAMLIASGNDAAETLAAAAGGRSATLLAMREEATRLQAFHTVPGTPSGLDAPGQQTTAYDLALIGRAALDDPAVAPYLTVARATLSSPGVKSFQIDSHNPLLGIYPGVIGVKAGYTSQAQATYVGASERMGHRIIISMLFAYPRFKPAATGLLDWGFAARGRVEPIATLASPLTSAAVAPDTVAAQPTGTAAGAPAGTTAKAAPSALVVDARSGVKHRLLTIAGTLAVLCAGLRFRVRLQHARRRGNLPAVAARY